VLTHGVCLGTRAASSVSDRLGQLVRASHQRTFHGQRQRRCGPDPRAGHLSRRVPRQGLSLSLLFLPGPLGAWRILTEKRAQANELIGVTDGIVRALDGLKFAPYKARTMREVMESVQHQVDQLSRDALTNLDAWVSKLNERAEGILAARLRLAIRAWTTAFVADVGGSASQAGGDSAAATANTSMMGTDPVLDTSGNGVVRLRVCLRKSRSVG
jgi:hypothetical protein